MTGRRAVQVVGALLVACVLLVGCGTRTDVARDGSAGASSGTTGVTYPPPPPGASYSLAVTGLRVGSDGRSVVFTTGALPPDDAPPECQVLIDHVVEIEQDRLYITLSFRADPETAGVGVPGCPTGEREVVVDVGQLVAGLDVITQDPAARWLAGTDGRYSRCELPGCDAATGGPPAPATCDDSTLADAARSSDVPRHSGLGNERCELPWAVIDIDVSAGACAPNDGGPRACGGTDVRRTYWHVDGYTWRQVGASVGPGCGEIATVVPEFPTHLCADLPPLPGR